MYIFKHTPENISKHRRSTSGWEFVAECNSIEAFKKGLELKHYQDWFDQEDGSVLDQTGNEVYDPRYPDTAEFGDFTYFLVDESDLNPQQKLAVEVDLKFAGTWQ